MNFVERHYWCVKIKYKEKNQTWTHMSATPEAHQQAIERFKSDPEKCEILEVFEGDYKVLVGCEIDKATERQLNERSP